MSFKPSRESPEYRKRQEEYRSRQAGRVVSHPLNIPDPTPDITDYESLDDPQIQLILQSTTDELRTLELQYTREVQKLEAYVRLIRKVLKRQQ